MPTPPPHPKTAPQFTTAFVLTVSLFALWGTGHRFYETLEPEFSASFALDSFASALTSSLYSAVYFVGAIPAAFYALRFGYKAAILFGLGCIIVGAFTFYPAAETHTVAYFVFATAVMSCGWIFLEVAANPLIAGMGPRRRFISRLNLAQGFYPLGALVGTIVGHWILDQKLATPSHQMSIAVAHPYILLGAGVMLLAFLFEEARFPPVASHRIRGTIKLHIPALLSQRTMIAAILAQFFGIVALASIWWLAPVLWGRILPGTQAVAWTDPAIWALLSVAAGRFAGASLLRRFHPIRLLAIFCAGGAAASALVGLTGGWTAAIAILAAGFSVSIVWPTVLGIAIRDKAELIKPATALIVMGGAAGGVTHSLINVVWRIPSASVAALIPLVGFAAVFFLTFLLRKKTARAA